MGLLISIYFLYKNIFIKFYFYFFLLPLFSSCFLLGVGTKMAARQFQFSRKKKKKLSRCCCFPSTLPVFFFVFVFIFSSSLCRSSSVIFPVLFDAGRSALCRNSDASNCI